MVHDSYEIAVMHPKAAPCAGLGLASHDALGVTDFHGGIQPNRALIRVLPLVLSLGTVSMHRQVPGVERYDVECAGLENLSLFVTSCQIRSEEANCMLQQRHRRDCPPKSGRWPCSTSAAAAPPRLPPESGRWPCSTSAAAAPPRLPPESGCWPCSTSAAAAPPRLPPNPGAGRAAHQQQRHRRDCPPNPGAGRAAHQQQWHRRDCPPNPGAGRAAHQQQRHRRDCPPNPGAGRAAHQQQRHRRDCLPRPGIRRGVLAAAATPRPPPASGHQARCSGGSGNAATACRVRASGGVFWRQRQRRDRLPRPGIRRGVLAAAATPRPSPASGHQAGCSGGSGNAATVSRVRASGGVLRRQRQRRDRLPRPGIRRGVLAAAATPRPSPASGHRAGCSGGSGNAATVSRVRASGGVLWRQRQRRDRLPRPGIGRGVLAAAATPRPSPASGHRAGCSGGSGNAATACPVRASGGMHWRHRQRRDSLPPSGHQAGCTGSSGIDRDSLPRPC